MINCLRILNNLRPSLQRSIVHYLSNNCHHYYVEFPLPYTWYVRDIPISNSIVLMLLEVLRRHPLSGTSQKVNVTTNTTKNEVNIRFRKSTTTQRPQTTHQGKVINIEDLLRRVEERVRALDRAAAESQRASGKQRELQGGRRELFF